MCTCSGDPAGYPPRRWPPRHGSVFLHKADFCGGASPGGCVRLKGQHSRLPGLMSILALGPSSCRQCCCRLGLYTRRLHMGVSCLMNVRRAVHWDAARGWHQHQCLCGNLSAWQIACCSVSLNSSMRSQAHPCNGSDVGDAATGGGSECGQELPDQRHEACSAAGFCQGL